MYIEIYRCEQSTCCARVESSCLCVCVLSRRLVSRKTRAHTYSDMVVFETRCVLAVCALWCECTARRIFMKFASLSAVHCDLFIAQYFDETRNIYMRRWGNAMATFPHAVIWSSASIKKRSASRTGDTFGWKSSVCVCVWVHVMFGANAIFIFFQLIGSLATHTHRHTGER